MKAFCLNKPQRTHPGTAFTFISAVSCCILFVAGQIQFLSEAGRVRMLTKGPTRQGPFVKPAAKPQGLTLSSDDCLITPRKLPNKMNLIFSGENVL